MSSKINFKFNDIHSRRIENKMVQGPYDRLLRRLLHIKLFHSVNHVKKKKVLRLFNDLLSNTKKHYMALHHFVASIFIAVFKSCWSS